VSEFVMNDVAADDENHMPTISTVSATETSIAG